MQLISRQFIYVNDRTGVYDGKIGDFKYGLEYFTHRDILDPTIDIDDLQYDDKPDNLDDSFFYIIDTTPI